MKRLCLKTISTLLICFLIISPISFLVPTKVSAGNNEWTGNGPEGGNTSVLAISPNYAVDQTIFAGTYNGVYKSTDGGATWSSVSTGLTDPRIKTLAISPNYAIDQTIFAGISFFGGVFKSTDGGANWSPVNTGLPVNNININSFAISPDYANDQIIFIGTDLNGGVFKSSDGGANWGSVNTGLTVNIVYSLAIGPDYSENDTETIFAGTSSGVFKSTDGGANWGSVNTGLSNISTILAISPDYTNDQTIFAESGVSGDNIFKSTDGGANWSPVYTQLTPPNFLTFLAISPDYAVDQTIFTGTYFNGIFKSTDGGTNWNSANTGLTNTSRTFVFSPNYANDQTIFAGTTSGVFKSTDGGANWSSGNTGLSNKSIVAVAISADFSNDQTIVAGSGGGVNITTDGGASWSQINTGLTSINIIGMAISPNHVNDQTIYALTDYKGVFKSTDGGANWGSVNTGLPSSLGDYYLKTLVISPNYANDQTIFAGADNNNGVFKSTDGGANWSPVNTGLSGVINALSISSNYANDQFILAGTDLGKFKSTDGGATWSEIASLPYTALAFVISPDYTNDETIFAGTTGGVYKSTDGGATWSEVSAVTDIKKLAISPNYSADQTIFTGTWGGVIMSTDGGTSWSQINNGLISTYIHDLAISPNYANDQTIVAGTEGGVLSYSFVVDVIPPVTTLDSNPSSPDGENGWFKTTPTTITLSPDETATTFYSWDSTASATTYTVPLSYPSEGIHTLYFYSIDSANNTETTKSQLFKVDTTDPSDPTSITSPSHSTSQWSTNNNVSVNFSGAADPVSDIDGYSVSWSENGTETPDTTLDLQEDATSTIGGTLADGSWYFNLRTKDNAGNWTSTVHYGPFNISRPDLVIKSITRSKQNPTTGELISVDVVVKNQGTTDTVAYNVILFNDPLLSPIVGDPGNIPPDISKGSIGLAAGVSETLTFSNISWPVIGQKDLYAIVDTANDIPESNENNNVFGPVEVKVYDDKLGVLNSWDSGSNNWSFDASKVTRGDYDGDGRDDIAFMYGYRTQRDVKVLVARGKSDGTFAAPAPWWQAGAGNWDWNGSKLVSGDFNGDGKDDLSVLYGYKTQRDVKAFVLRSTGNSFRSPAAWWQAGAGNWDWNGSKLDVGDFNGDGKDDLVILYGYKTQRDVKAFVLRSTGTSFNTPHRGGTRAPATGTGKAPSS